MFRGLQMKVTICLQGIQLTATCSQHRLLLLRVIFVYFVICSFSRLSRDLVHNWSKCTLRVLLSSLFFPGIFWWGKVRLNVFIFSLLYLPMTCQVGRSSHFLCDSQKSSRLLFRSLTSINNFPT